ncbi:hypothetical protein ABDJ41_08995 [Pedobacter sp. ASV1-7]|uniref:hypothetical protein n=1 Tax=Pedobacter sp. ASV1-7 TaxID=3145237 RepID=UPI0032E8F2B9
MKPYLLNKGWKGIALISLSMMLTSCLDDLSGGAPGAERKKMPRFYDAQFQQSKALNGKSYSSCGMISEVDLINLDSYGNYGDYYSIALTDSEADESVFAMVRMFKPLASGYLADWSRKQNKGMILDLRSNQSGSSTREEYLLENGQQFSVPVVLVWNAASALRAQRFTALLNDLPGINSKRINSKAGNF